MKNLKSITNFALATLALMFLMTSCSKEEIKDLPTKDKISATHLERLEAMNFNTENIRIEEIDLPDGTKEKSYLLEEDLALPVAQIEAFLQNEIIQSPEGEQRRLTSIVAAPRLIKILGYTGAGFALTPKMRTALSWAVNNYNALGLTINFSLSFGGQAEIAGSDMVVYKVNNAAAGSSSGFPSAGTPYKWVRVNSGSDAFPYNFVEGLITHSIGHCVGVVHTDGTAGFHLPGTPVVDPNSIFNMFIPAGTNGEFDFWDRFLLNDMY